MWQATERERTTLRPSDEANAEQIKLSKAQGTAFQRALDHMRNGQLEWRDPQNENAHVEVVVRDAADGRFLPGLTVYATLIDHNGIEIATHQQPFLWHPWLYHYGRNWRVPGNGTYTLRVRIEPPEFMRHDKTNGKRFAEPVELAFDDVTIQTGQKRN